MDNEVAKAIVSMVCDNYVDLLLTNIDEDKACFPYTISCINFISELKREDIDLKFNDIFVDKFIDKIYIEFANFLSEAKNYE